uniref:Uncharacterized protein n=1 Tax=Daphnia galeata TaxID=27404 RepID=A0A8J2WHF5_9CRUS|nr:unnamed protein product [Daphnia galeata]
MSGVFHDEATQLTDDGGDELLALINESESESGSSQTANDEMPPESEKGSDAGHVNSSDDSGRASDYKLETVD